MLTIEQISNAVKIAAAEYPIKSVALFGSYAKGTNTEDSDVDLLVEFEDDSVITLLTICSLKYRFEDLLSKEVDVIHAPVSKDSILEIDKAVTLYAA
ncbi:MAG: nucleotidyltransferase domain-containing protein [Firmicutes bacterium]|nr:nucleotidyltransferase domain-containing protein [Oscillospiraceae bacterium]MCD8181112.1 nucleotidyltransferase domain-containing protein [Bacillota bacterium]